MRGSQLTTKEIGAMEEILRVESVTAKKAAVYAEMVRDPELRNLAEQASREAKRHVKEITSELEG